MGWHADDDYDAGAHSGVASISLGATRRFRLRSRDAARRSVGVDLGPGSLLFMEPGTQSAWQHALPRTARAIGPRLNLTFRHLVADNVRG
jgi:alkylated DNA repair dioxygenase AlkB